MKSNEEEKKVCSNFIRYIISTREVRDKTRWRRGICSAEVTPFEFWFCCCCCCVMAMLFSGIVFKLSWKKEWTSKALGVCVPKQRCTTMSEWNENRNQSIRITKNMKWSYAKLLNVLQTPINFDITYYGHYNILAGYCFIPIARWKYRKQFAL